MLLLQGDSKISIVDSLQKRIKTQYLLQDGDILDIKVSSLDAQSVAIFNKRVGGASNNQVTEASLYVNGYIIDKSGTINLPLIGTMQVRGLTLDSLNKKMTVELASYFKYFTVNVNLVNFRVSILGEVKKAGIQYVYNSNTNLLNIIAKAGGVSNHGNRRKVKVIRKLAEGSVSAIIDLSKEEVIYNEFFYVMPDDIIYIQPHKSKMVSLNVPLMSLLLTTASFAILILNTIKK